MIGAAIRAGFKIGVSDFSRAWTAPTWIFGWSVRILANASVWIFLGKLLGSNETTTYLLIGNATLAGPIAITWTIAAATWERIDGTYVLLMGAPTNIWGVMLGRTSVWLINGLATTLMAFIMLGVLFDVHPAFDRVLLLAVCLAITCASVYALALSIGVIATVYYRLRIILSNLAHIIFMTFCGVSVPITFWPEPLVTYVQLFPLVHGLEAIRAVYANAPTSVIAQHIALELGTGCVWLLASYLMYLAINSYGRKVGDVGSL